ncbi:MAG TPA: ATP-binding cassette domain-containing protein [Terriglobales bacterium]|nr:ATP-binding cassette domain-containing protein [Terriglobales bacterium]
MSKRFGEVQALDDVSLEIKPGEVFGFLGANGAGKTTAMRLVLDILRPDSGTITWNGTLNSEVPRDTWGYLPEERGLYAKMNVFDQLVFFAKLHGVRGKAAQREVRDWLERFRIPEYADRRAEQLSKGNQQKIQFIAAILHDPQVLLMDEPFTGLDPVNVALLKEAFLEMKDRGKTLIFSTHHMETVEELCQAIAILDRGRVVVGGAVRDVRRSTGRQVVRLAVDGDLEVAWLGTLDGVRVSRRGQDYTEAGVAPGHDPELVLQEALRRGCRVLHFEIADPSLEEIFIEHVGQIDTSERTLAPKAVHA